MSTETLPVLTRDNLRERCGGVWSYVSASRLNLWLKCPLAFRLKYIDGVPLPMSPAQFVGRRVHEGLEVYYRHRQVGVTLQPHDVIERMQTVWPAAIETDAMKFTDSAAERTHWQQTHALVLAYLAQLPPSEARPLAVETAIEAPLVDLATGEDLGLPLVGVVDLVLDEPTGPVITDFKTTSRGGELAEITHEVQLTSYAYLFRHATQKTEGGLEIRNLVKTKTPKVENHRFMPRTDAHFRRLFAVVRAYLDDLDRGRFIFRPGLTCPSCDFRDTHCRDWTG